MKKANHPSKEHITLRCLGAFIHAGTLDLSLDRLAGGVGISKRMLIHYFGSREALEEEAITLLEDRLRAQFAPERFPPDVSFQEVIASLWKQTAAPESHGVLLLVMDVSRRAWSGSSRARAFYEEQQRLWVKLLLAYMPNETLVERTLQLFQGGVVAFLVTGDSTRGERALWEFAAHAQLISQGTPNRSVRTP